FGPDGIRGLLGQESCSFQIEADVELSGAVVEDVNQQVREMKRIRPHEPSNGPGNEPGKLAFVREKSLRYRIELEILPQSGILRIADEYLAALNTEGEPTGIRKPFLERVGNRLHLRMEGQAHPTYYERFLDRSLLSQPLYPHLVAMRQELARWF